MTRRDWLILLCIVLLAGALRFYQLGVVPPGPQFDEAFNALDAKLVMAGNRPLFLPANGGREVVFTYIQAAVGALAGLNVYTLRLVSAAAGTLTVVAVYFTVFGLFRRNRRWLAAMTALALAVSYWHIHFSHYGIRVILMPLLFCGVFGLFWLGMHGNTRRTRLLAVLGSGALAGLSVWTNPTGRFTPFVVGAYVLWLLWRHPAWRPFQKPARPDADEPPRGWLDRPVGGLLLWGAVAFVVFLPLGLEFWRHPEFFTGHASEVSIFADRVTGGGSPWPLLANNVLRVLGMFSFDGDMEWAHGIPDRPVFDWFMAVPFYIGVVLWALRLLGKDRPQPDPDRDALALFLCWAAVMLAPSVLSEAAPNYSRTLPAVPAVMLAAGLGLTWIGTLPRLRPAWGPILVGVLVAASVVVTFYDYFVRYPAFREVYYLYDADKADAVAWLEAQAGAGNAVYLSPLWSNHSTVAFLRSGRIESLDPADAIVLPAEGKGAIYAWPAEQQSYAEDVADRLDVPVAFVEQPEMKGQTDAIIRTRGLVERDALILFPDMLFEADFSGLTSTDADVVMFTKEVDDPSALGIAVVEDGLIVRLIEKPQDPISKLAVIGIYYVRNVEDLYTAIEEQMERGLSLKNEYFIADAIQLMIDAGARVVSMPVSDWEDCGNAENLLNTNRYLLDRVGAERSRGDGATIIAPSVVAPDATIENSVIGPYASIGHGVSVRDSVVRDSIVDDRAMISRSLVSGSLVGRRARLNGVTGSFNIGDDAVVSN